MPSVIDTSIAVKWFVDEPGHGEARALLGLGEYPSEELHAPTLLLAEAFHAVGKRVGRGQATAGQLDVLVKQLPVLVSLEADGIDLIVEATTIARAFVLHGAIAPASVCDCVFIAMARRHRLPLITADNRPAEIAAKSGIEVRVLG